MPRKPLGDKPMTDAERQTRHRAARVAGSGAGKPVTRMHRPAVRGGRAQRWRDAVVQLTTLQAEYAAWLETLPPNLHESATAEASQAICDLDLSELQVTDPPRGFGRD